MELTNREAQNVIDHTIKREEDCKLQVLSELINSINTVCRKNKLDYFAVGKLLTWCLTGEDSYHQDYQYDIGMLRKDYDQFAKAIEACTDGDDIQIRSMFHSSGVLQRLATYLVKRKIFHFDEDTVDIEVRICIHPYELLPADEKERKGYMREIMERSSEYRRLSQKYRYLRRDAGSLRANPVRVPVLVKDKLTLGHLLLKKKKEYHQLLHRYDGSEELPMAGQIGFLTCPPHKMKDIFPVQPVKLSDTEVMVPAHPDIFAFLPKEKENQKVFEGRLGALHYFDELCREHDLSYVAMEELAIACSHDDPEELLQSLDKPWMLGMLRKDYEAAVKLLEKAESSVEIIRSLEQYPFVCSDKAAICLKGYEKQLPRQNSGMVYLLPFDALPSDYEEKLSFSDDMKALADTMQKTIRYELGLDYKQMDHRLNSWKLFDLMQKKLQKYNGTVDEPEQIFAITGGQMISMPYNEIFPVSERAIFGQTVSCAVNPFFWHVKKDPAYTEYLADRRAKIMKIIDELSRKNQIDYFAMSNLLIGAVIYHDVMPQSDQRNMDIGLLRKDYEAFIRLVRDTGADYGISLNESLDGKGKYPLEVKYITFTGCRYSQARVRLLPFDKVPEDFYLYQGLRDEIDQKNDDYKQLLKLYNAERKTMRKLPASLDKNKREYLEKAVPKEEAAKIEKLARSFNDDERTSSYMWIAFGKSKIITQKELYPLQRVRFRDMEINCPGDTSVWQPVLDAELQRQVSCIQDADILLLKEFDKVCTKLGLGYFVCGGTMLGYMRHEGFIPWDDDVDVAMLRKDYDRFIRDAGPLLPDRFFLQTRETDPNIPYLFSKIRLDDTEYITKYNENRDFHKGICLDIFPFDFLPEDEDERKRFIKEVQKLAKEHHLIARRQFPVPDRTCQPRNEQEQRYINEQKELLQQYWEKDLAVSQKAYLDAATRYNSQAEKKKLRTVASFVPSYTYIDLGDLLPYQRGRFEGIEVSVPKRPDIFLKMQYGDYMQMPPKHMQVAHRLLRWSTWEARGSISDDNADADSQQKGSL